MRALLLRDTGGPSSLRLEDVPEPGPVDGFEPIAVDAAGVGFVDWLITKGEYQITPPLPFVPGLEVVGRRPDGSRVIATTMMGAFAEQVVAPSFLVFDIPDALGDEAAAGFFVNYQTAHLALKVRGRMAAGETVLVHGAAGGVGTASIQVARALGAARVIAVAGGERKVAVAREAGADDAVDPDGDWVAAVREITGGRGADLVVDPVGGERFEQSLRCMAPFGRLLVIGFAGGTIPTLKANRLLLRHLDVIGVNFGGLVAIDQAFPRAAHEDLMRWFGEGTIRPVVGGVYPLAEGAKALEELGARRATGKPVLRVT